MKSVREVEEYVVHPNELKNLKTGEALLVCSKVDPHFCIMKINLAEEYCSHYKKIGGSGKWINHQRDKVYHQHKKDRREVLRPQDLF